MVSTPVFRGRPRELGILRGGYDGREATLRWVVGLPGVGKTETVLRAAADFRFLYHRVPPLSDPLQRLALAASLRVFRETGGEGPDEAKAGEATTKEPTAESAPTWEALFRGVVEAGPEGQTLVVVVDDAHRWVESRARFESALQGALNWANALGRPVHVTLVAPELVSTRLTTEDLLSPLRMEHLSFRAAVPFLPGATTWDRLRSYAVFGGLPGVLTLLDRRASLGSNLRRLVLGRDAPLRDAPITLLERYFHRPNRYAAILAALAEGEGDWNRVQAGVGDLTASGQAGPYLKRLEEVGLVKVRRSLDASPRTRSRRYRITDPFVAYWFRFVLPLRESLVFPPSGSLSRRAGGAGSGGGIPLGLKVQVDSILPAVCRSYMTFDAMEEFGSNARECGSLWGQAYDLPVAGVLGNGTPFYGQVVPLSAESGPQALAAMDRQIRETRYGFGRERRLRILFCGGKISSGLRRAVARRDDAALVDLDSLAGGGDDPEAGRG